MNEDLVTKIDSDGAVRDTQSIGPQDVDENFLGNIVKDDGANDVANVNETLLGNEKQDEDTAPATGPNPHPSQAQIDADKKEVPNIRLGQHGTPLPEGLTNFGDKSVMIPDEATQRSGFFVAPEDANAFIAQFGGYKYKEVKPKG